jgi:integrase
VRGERERICFSEQQQDQASGRLKTAFNNACKDAKVEDFHFHDPRRTGATRLAESGADAFYIQALLGHTDAKTSQIYTVATSAGLRRTLEALVTKENKTVTLFPTPQEFEESATAVNS